MTAETLTFHIQDGGDIVIKLRPDLAPNHVARIVELAQEGFYDGVKFHRVIAGFMAQGGCPNGTGTGGSKKPDLKQEFNDEPHVEGVCSMARTMDPNSANSQFFICLGREHCQHLDGQYTGFGRVVEGIEVVRAIGAADTDGRDCPMEPIVMTEVKMKD